jgi:hypothetical protein
MKLNFALLLSAGLIFLSGCITKPHRHTASVQPKTVTEYADYTMVNITSHSRMPASASQHVDLSDSPDQVLVYGEYFDADAASNKHAEMTFTLREHPELSATITGNSVGSVKNQLFVAILKDISDHGLRPLANQALSGVKLQVGSLVSLPQEQREESLKTFLLEFRDQLLAIYSDLAVSKS